LFGVVLKPPRDELVRSGIVGMRFEKDQDGQENRYF
jgi:hypothetical protein